MGLGVFSGRGKSLVLWRGTGKMSSRKNGKRTAGTPDGCLRSTWKGKYSPDPCRISSNPGLGSAVFPQVTFALRANRPRRGRLSFTGENPTLVWYARLWEESPFRGRGCLEIVQENTTRDKTPPTNQRENKGNKIADLIIYPNLRTRIKLFWK